MERQSLEIETQDHKLHGVNSVEVLNMFINYQSMCSDPLLIFRYMEEKVICTFLPLFWITKANLLAQIGEYAICFECIQQARSRTQQEDVQQMNYVNDTQKTLTKKMVEEMRRFPLKTKRSVEEFDLGSERNAATSTKQTLSKAIKFYEQKYQMLKKEKAKQTRQKWDKLPKPWLFHKYQKEDQMEKIIEQKIHQHSIQISKDVKYHSMHTPIRNRDPQRLTKTMDSVEIMKKKRSTRQKSNNRRRCKEENDSQNENQYDCLSNSQKMNSLPVGRKFTEVKRRVTFQMQSQKVQKLRNEQPSSSKIELLSSNFTNSEQKMDEEIELIEKLNEFQK